MARKRMIDPAIWDDEDVGGLSPGAFKLFIALISNADDEGRLEYSDKRLHGIAFRYDYGITPVMLREWLTEVTTALRSVVLYEHGGKQYIALLKWSTYQSINHPTPSKLPLPEHSRRTPVGLTPDSIDSLGSLGSLVSPEEVPIPNTTVETCKKDLPPSPFRHAPEPEESDTAIPYVEPTAAQIAEAEAVKARFRKLIAAQEKANAKG